MAQPHCQVVQPGKINNNNNLYQEMGDLHEQMFGNCDVNHHSIQQYTFSICKVFIHILNLKLDVRKPKYPPLTIKNP